MQGGLLAMIIVWAVQGKPHYVTQEGSIPCEFINFMRSSSLLMLTNLYFCSYF